MTALVAAVLPGQCVVLPPSTPPRPGSLAAAAAAALGRLPANPSFQSTKVEPPFSPAFLSPTGSFHSAASSFRVPPSPSAGGGGSVTGGAGRLEADDALDPASSAVLLDVAKWALRVVKDALGELVQAAIEQPPTTAGAMRASGRHCCV